MGCKFFFLFIGWEPNTWPAINCLQTIVCSWEMSSNCVWLQMIFCSCVNETTLFSLLRQFFCEIGNLLMLPTDKSQSFAQPGPIIIIVKYLIGDWSFVMPKLKKGVAVCMLTLISPLFLYKIAPKKVWISGSRSGCKESQFYSLPFGQALASMY